MKLRLSIGIFVLAYMPFLCCAQGKIKEKKGETKIKAAPAWSAADKYSGRQDVYFPDYYVFYDPERGYYYWSDNKWTTSDTIPAFMSGIDMDKARVEVITGEITDPQNAYLIYKK